MARRIGEFLVSEGRISEAALLRALQAQAFGARRIRLGGILLGSGLLAEHELLDALAKFHRCPAVDWGRLSSASREAVRLLSADQAIRIGAIPYAAEKRSARVAFVNPSSVAAIDEVAAITGRRVLPAVTTEVRLQQAHQHFYGRSMSRELWTIVERLDEKMEKASTATPATPGNRDLSPGSVTPPPPPAFFEPPGLSADIPLSLEETEQMRPAGPHVEMAPPSVTAAEKGGEKVDPFSDDWPLTNFVAGALESLASAMDLDAVLASVADEPEEDLDPSTAEEVPPAKPDPDATQPSRSRSRPASRTQL